jgi:hypothetical protein
MSSHTLTPQRILLTNLSVKCQSANIDVEHQFSAFSNGTPPLFCHVPHIVDQIGKVILIDRYPLLFQALGETGGIEAIV